MVPCSTFQNDPCNNVLYFCLFQVQKSRWMARCPSADLIYSGIMLLFHNKKYNTFLLVYATFLI